MRLPLPGTIGVIAVLALSGAAATGAGAQTSQPPVAKVTVSGKEMGTVITFDGTKKDRYVLLEEDARTTLKVATAQDVTKFAEEVLAQHQHLTEGFQAASKKFIETNDLDGIKKAERAFNAASDELVKNIGNVTAVGTLTMTGDELRIEGKMRVFDSRGLDKALGKGKALVVGEATQVNYDAGLGAKRMLAVHNGTKAIVVTGKAAESQGSVVGTIRVLGVLRAGKNGHAVLEAEKIEAIQK